MFEKAEYESHPNRCQAVNAQGQCRNLGIQLPDGTRTQNCLAHGGNKQVAKREAEGLRNYRLTKWNAKVQRFGNQPDIKSLRDEIGILRLLMEERLNRCNDAQDLILQSAPISDMVMKIEKVVASCHKLEGSMGLLLDKQALLQFAQKVISIVASVLEGQEENIDAIADGILEALSGSDDHTS